MPEVVSTQQPQLLHNRFWSQCDRTDCLIGSNLLPTYHGPRRLANTVSLINTNRLPTRCDSICPMSINLSVTYCNTTGCQLDVFWLYANIVEVYLSFSFQVYSAADLKFLTIYHKQITLKDQIISAVLLYCFSEVKCSRPVFESLFIYSTQLQ